MVINNLVSDFNPSEKQVNWDDDSQSIWKKHKSCSKPPTKYWYIWYMFGIIYHWIPPKALSLI